MNNKKVMSAIAVLLAVLMNVVGKNITEKEFSERNVVAGRINSEIEAELAGLELTLEKEVEETLYDKVFLGKRDEWKSLYGSDNCPSDIKIVMLYDQMSGQTENQTLNQSERLDIRSGSAIKGIYLNDELTGFVEYEFDSSVYSKLLLLMNIALAIAAVIILIYGLWIRSRLILPFNDLSDYPENVQEIMEVSRHYFHDIHGDWYMTTLFNNWLSKTHIGRPEWFNPDI